LCGGWPRVRDRLRTGAGWATAPAWAVITGVVGCGAFRPVDGFRVGGHAGGVAGDELGVLPGFGRGAHHGYGAGPVTGGR
jgi:hypothetical protein